MWVELFLDAEINTTWAFSLACPDVEQKGKREGGDLKVVNSQKSKVESGCLSHLVLL